jgi:hypothetical protein
MYFASIPLGGRSWPTTSGFTCSTLISFKLLIIVVTRDEYKRLIALVSLEKHIGGCQSRPNRHGDGVARTFLCGVLKKFQDKRPDAKVAS